MPQPPDPHEQTVRLEPSDLSDDTRPVPRDRGPVGKAPAASGTAAGNPGDDRAGDGPEPREDPGGEAEPPAPDTPTTTSTDPPATTVADPADGGVPTSGPAEPGAAPAAADAPASASAADGTPPTAGPPGGHNPRDGGSGDGSGAGGTAAGAPQPRRPWWRRPSVLAPVVTLAVLAGAYGVDLLLAGNGIPRNTVVAGVEIGGLSASAAAERLEEELAPRIAADHVVVADDVEATLSPATAGILLDVEGTVEAAEDQPLNPWTRLVSLFADREVDPVITGEDTALAAQIDALAAQVDRAPVDATIVIEETTPRIVEPVPGRTLDREGAAEAITEALASGGDPTTPIELPVEVTEVSVEAEEAERVLAEIVAPGLAAPVTVTSQDAATSVEVPVTAIAASLTFTPQDDGELTVAIDPAALQEAMGDEFGAFGAPPQDARFQISGDSISVVPSVDGVGVDPGTLADQLRAVLPEPAPRTVTAELGPVPAEFTTADAEALGIRERVSSFTTNFTNPASGTNIRVVAEEVDGAIVPPGETFSLNGYTGPRGTAQGYVEAGVISNGEFTTAVGGGISQFATTMFNAVFFAGLEDVYHKPHSYYISRYPAGREATVYYDSIDLKWRNDTDTGIYVQTEWAPGAITVTFWGTKYYEIESLSSNRYNIRQPVVQEKIDDGNCTPQSGSTGFDITVTRVFRDLQTGAELRREDFHTRYAAEPVIRCVPPASGAAPPPAPEGAAPAPGPAPGGRRPERRRTG